MNISEQSFKKIREELLHILEWTMDSNKQVALDMIEYSTNELLALIKEIETSNNEDWLSKNANAKASVMRGLEDSAAGRISERKINSK